MARITVTGRVGRGVRAIACGIAAVAVACAAQASGGGAGPTEPAGNNVANIASLQRGARNFVNYCMGCHSAKYVRYNQLARDLGMSEDQVVRNLMFAASKPQDTMDVAMRADDATRWFGQAPPDLSLIARAKGTDYVYNFLRTFYQDPARPNGANNLMLPNASMPHVLWELQGVQKAVFENVTHDGVTEQHFVKFEQVVPGKLDKEEYDLFVRDTVNFLEYIAEPVKLQRQSLGILVIAFLVVFGILAYLLKLEIWKDVR